MFMQMAARRRRMGGFSPLGLFISSEPGVWLDPSDLSTLFQDDAGTTPVTAAGQSVGMVLDKSQGLVLGSELASDMTSKAGAVTLVDGNTFNHAATGTGVVAFDTGVSVGKSFRVTIELDIAAPGYAECYFANTVTGAPPANSYRLPVGAKTASFIINSDAGSFFNLLYRDTSGVAKTVNIISLSIRELPGNHATQSIFASRPIYQVDSGGRGYLSFDGIDDFLVTPTVTPGTDKVQVFAGVRKLSDAAAGVIAEHSASVALNNGGLALSAPASAAANITFGSKGTVQADAAYTNAAVAAPVTTVVAGLGDVAGDAARLRVNGALAAETLTDQGTGNYLSYPLYIGRRGGTTLPFNGRLYGLITRFGPNLTADQINQTERWMNARTGAF